MWYIQDSRQPHKKTTDRKLLWDPKIIEQITWVCIQGDCENSKHLSLLHRQTEISFDISTQRRMHRTS